MKESWYKGALHTHSFASDGTGFPEEVVLAYRRKGFDFVAITDHNAMNCDRNLWLPVLRPAQGPFQGDLPYVGGCAFEEAVDRYRKNCPGEVDVKHNSFYDYVRVKTLAEVARRYDEPGRFLVLGGEEISHWFDDPRGGRRQLHLGAVNLKRPLFLPERRSIAATLHADRLAVEEQFSRQREPGLFIFNHPHGYWFDLEPQLLIDEPDIRHFELVNSNVDGVGGEASLPNRLPRDNEMFWDMVNAFRADRGQPLLFAVAADDAHYYTPDRIDRRCGAGMAWVTVRVAGRFTRRALMDAMDRGDYYPSCGAEFESVDFDAVSGRLMVRVKAEKGVKYRIRFTVSRKGFDRKFHVVELARAERSLFRSVSLPGPGIGVTAAEFDDATAAEYRLGPEDLYVRATVISDRPARCRSNRHPEFESAWTQPFRRRAEIAGKRKGRIG